MYFCTSSDYVNKRFQEYYHQLRDPTLIMPPKKHTRNEDETQKEPSHHTTRTCTVNGCHDVLISINMTIVWESRIYVAFPQIQLIEVDEFGPVASVLGYGYLEPWFQVAIVMYDSSSFDVLLADIWVIAKTEDMPWPVKGVSAIPKRD